MKLTNELKRLFGACSSPLIRLKQENCLRTRYRAASCSACAIACPAGAIFLENSVVINETRCLHCGLCLRSCPTEAFAGKDIAGDLLRCALVQPLTETFALTYGRHPQPENVPKEVDKVIMTDACLATLGPATYLGLLALGRQRFLIRLDACRSCPAGAVRGRIEESLETARSLLNVKEEAERLAMLDSIGAETWISRPVLTSRSPPLSRRQLLHLFAPKASTSLPFSAFCEEVDHPGQGHPPQERRRLLEVLRLLSLGKTAKLPEAAVVSPGSARLSVSDGCSACGACANICPTSALVLQEDKEGYILHFSPDSCIDCRCCLGVCTSGALCRLGAATLAEILSPKKLILSEGPWRCCLKCRTRFAGGPLTDYCPSCAFRRRNPFSGRRMEPDYFN